MAIKYITTSMAVPSAMLLRDALVAEGVLEDSQSKKVLVTRRTDIEEEAIVVNYGNSAYPFSEGISPGEFVRVCSNKANTAEFLGDYSIQFHTEEPEEFPIVIRKTLTGFGGRGIEIAETPQEYMKKGLGHFWTPLYEKLNEYGVHCYKGKILRVFRKEPRSDSHIWSNENAQYKLVSLRPSLGAFMESLYLRVATQFPNVYFRADIMEISKNSYLTLELNSAPGLNLNSASLLACAILGKETKWKNDSSEIEE